PAASASASTPKSTRRRHSREGRRRLRQGQSSESHERRRAQRELSPVRCLGRRRRGADAHAARHSVAHRNAGRCDRAYPTPAHQAPGLTRGFAMFEHFTHTRIETSGARINLRHGGSGPPLLLLHGNPLTHVMWHKIAPRLAEQFTVVATDLRGYGDSSKPEGGDDHAGYSFRAMAKDQVEVMTALGFDSFNVCGHDRG